MAEDAGKGMLEGMLLLPASEDVPEKKACQARGMVLGRAGQRRLSEKAEGVGWETGTRP